MRLIEDSFEPSGSLLRVDAGCGEPSYKRALFGSTWREAPVWIFAPSARGLSLRVGKLASTLMHSFAMRLLAKSDCLPKAKKVWYRQALRSGAVRR
jgi:hypothetical protein